MWGQRLVMNEDIAATIAAQVQEIRDLEAIKKLKARYFRCVDDHDWDAWRDLLSEDYRLETETGVLEGRDEIVSFVSAALNDASTIHQVFAPDITITGTDTASGIWAYEDRIEFPTDAAPVVLHGFGYLHEEYVRVDSSWLVRSTIELKKQATDS